MNKLGYVNRPNSESLEVQAEKIDKSKEYYLYDDDIHTGNTMRYVTDFLTSHGIKIVGRFGNIESKEDEEILDARDFLTEGLVILTENGPKRFPYVLPFVLPSVRASVLNSKKFSEDLNIYEKLS